MIRVHHLHEIVIGIAGVGQGIDHEIEEIEDRVDLGRDPALVLEDIVRVPGNVIVKGNENERRNVKKKKKGRSAVYRLLRKTTLVVR